MFLFCCCADVIPLPWLCCVSLAALLLYGCCLLKTTLLTAGPTRNFRCKFVFSACETTTTTKIMKIFCNKGNTVQHNPRSGENDNRLTNCELYQSTAPQGNSRGSFYCMSLRSKILSPGSCSP
ncbi:uncharacterized protein LOC132785943 [Drosophila nasuta]|uniref:uncharacterized protein LOC132785943 n=1 Tax=Drosophila nasuta TaxID=42062 RepID=UPI00295E2AB0|nr:uncharacterized protein LOC132785943 [Drosophila nasuta]